ncbi:MAG: hypothetical protein WCQ72_00660 [Eubacteriales bacterium]
MGKGYKIMYSAVVLVFAVLVGVIAVALWWNYQYQAYDGDIVKYMGDAMSENSPITLSYYSADGVQTPESASLSNYGAEKARVILDVTERTLTFTERPVGGERIVLGLGDKMDVTIIRPDAKTDTVYVYFGGSRRKGFTLSNYRIIERLRQLIADESAQGT